ncbi:MAG: Sec-independent protein translocase protein TatB [Hyphomonadaceae bacterium]
MLPSLGFQEILLLGVLALVVIGPKDLPLLMRKLGRWTARLRGMAQEFRSGFDELARQAELDELKREVEALRNNSTLNDLQREISKPSVLPGTLSPKEAAPPSLPQPDTVTGADGVVRAAPAEGGEPVESEPSIEPRPAAAGGAS